jgi:hypothetical protein
MADGIEDLLRELVALSRKQLANQEAALARQAALMAGTKRRSVISLVLLLAVFVLIAYVVYLTQVVRGYHR